MVSYETPGVYVIEEPITPAIVGVGTSTAAFIGVSPAGNMPKDPDNKPYKAVPEGEVKMVTSFDQFTRFFGGFEPGNREFTHSVYGFFNNGGTRCYVARVGDIKKVDDVNSVLKKFAAIDEIAIVAAPGALEKEVQLAIISHCEGEFLQDRFAIIDGHPVKEFTEDGIRGGMASKSDYAALYYPYVMVANLEEDPPEKDKIIPIPPSGLMAGIYARVDNSRGVHKAPANEEVRGALGLTYQTSKSEQGSVNLKGINIIRDFSGSIVVWGARTLGSVDNKKIEYINVRRLMLFLRESIDEGTQWTVFEPNSKPLWEKIIRSVTALLTRVWRDGALYGTVPEQAFFVKCDESTNPKEIRDIGRVVIEIGVAPVKPAEFVIFRIHRFAEIPTA